MNARIAALSFAAVLAVVGVLILAQANPGEAARTFFNGTLGSPRAISGTLRETMPLLVAGLAVFVALRAGLFNIGVEGQLIVGALAAAVVGVALPGPAGLAVGVLAAAAAGALWALPAGLIKAYRGGHEVITTIMLNNIAGYVTLGLVAGPLKSATQQQPTTADVQFRLPLWGQVGQWQISPALFVGLALAVAIWFWMRKTVAGYELQAVGANPTAAKVAGVDAAKTLVKAMVASGAIAGLAGALMVFAYEGRFYANFSPGYGFTSLGVALLAGPSALAVVPAALLFGMLERGGTVLNILGVPKGVTILVLGLLVLVAGAVRYRQARSQDGG